VVIAMATDARLLATVAAPAAEGADLLSRVEVDAEDMAVGLPGGVPAAAYAVLLAPAALGEGGEGEPGGTPGGGS